MNILVVDDADFTRQIVVTLLETRYGAKTLEARSGNQAIELLGGGVAADCVICDYNMPDGNGGEVFKYIQAHRPGLPFILCSTEAPDTLVEFAQGELTASVDKTKIVPSLSRVLDCLTSSMRFHAGQPEYCRVDARVLRAINVVNCDLFIKLGDSKFVKVTNAGDPVDDSFIDGYRKKNVSTFFLRQQDGEAFLDYLVKHAQSGKTDPRSQPAPGLTAAVIASISDDGLRGSIEELAEALRKPTRLDTELREICLISSTAHERLKASISRLGVTSETEHLIKASVLFTLKTIRGNARLSELFELAQAKKGDGYSLRGMLVAHLACALAGKLGWSSDFTRHKLSLAAFLHDIALEEHLIKYQTLEDVLLERDLLAREDIDRYTSHVERAAALVAQLSDLAPDVDRIVLEHHERPDGSGFPKKLKHSQVSPLSAVFIVALDLTDYALERGLSALSLNDFLREHGADYELGRFKDIRRALASLQVA